VAGALGLVGLREAAGATCREVGSTCREHANCCSDLCGPKDRTGRQRCICQTIEDCPTPPRCRAAVCTPEGACTTTITEGAVCDDGNPCTTGETCDAAGSCVGTPVTDGTACGSGKICFGGSCVNCLANNTGPCTDDFQCCSGICDEANQLCIAPNTLPTGAACEADGDCSSNNCCSNACIDPQTDEANCGGCVAEGSGTTCTTGQICTGGSCACEFEECNGVCCTNSTDVCLGAPGSETCGAPQALGTVCFEGEQCQSGSCDRVQQINPQTSMHCCVPLKGTCTSGASGGNVSPQCCDRGPSGNSAACSGAANQTGTCCVVNNFFCEDVSYCCQQGTNGFCEPIASAGNEQRCCLKGGFCNAATRCCDGYACVSNSCQEI
jgi:hypothetical protein